MVPLGVLAVVLAAGLLYQSIGLHRARRRYPAPGTFIDVDGQKLHVVCAGDGRPAVVFESGIAATSLSWTRVQAGVAAFTRACAYDRAGLGWSDPSPRRRTIERILTELHGVVSHVSSDAPVVLVGHSFGAFVVCAYAAQYAQHVAGVVLVDPPSEWHELRPSQARLLRGGIQLSRIGGLLARIGVVRACLALLTGGAPGVPKRFVRVFGPTAAHTLERIVGEVRKLPADVYPLVQAHWCDPKCFRGMAQHLSALEETAAVVAAIRVLADVPVVVISSGDQPTGTLASQRQLTRLSGRGRHVIAPTSGHWVQFDDPDLVIETIRATVDEARTADGFT